MKLFQKIFHIEIDFKTHMKIHNGEKPFICNFPNCFRKFNRKSNLELHEKLFHQNKNKKSIIIMIIQLLLEFLLMIIMLIKIKENIN